MINMNVKTPIKMINRQVGVVMVFNSFVNDLLK